MLVQLNQCQRVYLVHLDETQGAVKQHHYQSAGENGHLKVTEISIVLCLGFVVVFWVTIEKYVPIQVT